MPLITEIQSLNVASPDLMTWEGKAFQERHWAQILIASLSGPLPDVARLDFLALVPNP